MMHAQLNFPTVPPPPRAIASAIGESPVQALPSPWPAWIRRSREATLVSVCVPEARAAEGDRFTDLVHAAYRVVGDVNQSSPLGHHHIVRMWNFIPGIHDRMSDGRDRYMAFNAGRYLAMRSWYGDALQASVPAASGVGIDGDAFVLHALLMREPGEAVENPNQRPAVRYSKQYGPLPPCFARATRVRLNGRPTLLVSGTAAITDETTMHAGDIDGQLRLTFANLRTLVAAGKIATETDALGAFDSLRVYVPPMGNPTYIERVVRAAFPDETETEFVPADLCRRDLLVEIEGIATSAGSGSPGDEWV